MPTERLKAAHHLRVVQRQNVWLWTRRSRFESLPASPRRLRLVDKDVRFSTWRHGFNSRRRYEAPACARVRCLGSPVPAQKLAYRNQG